jgi:hypothetical protein
MARTTRGTTGGAMSVFLWSLKTSYIAVPKIACTSVKTMLYEVENGHPFRIFKANGRPYYIHAFYPTMPFADLPQDRIADHARFALVRDPIRRFLSAYANRVRQYRELSVEKAGPALAAAELAPDPDLGTFIARIDDYAAAVGTIAHHTAPLVSYLGREPGYYAGIFGLQQMEGFLAALSARLGRSLDAPRLQADAPKIDPAALAGRHLDALKRRYAEDYETYGAWL